MNIRVNRIKIFICLSGLTFKTIKPIFMGLLPVSKGELFNERQDLFLSRKRLCCRVKIYKTYENLRVKTVITKLLCIIFFLNKPLGIVPLNFSIHSDFPEYSRCVYNSYNIFLIF